MKSQGIIIITFFALLLSCCKGKGNSTPSEKDFPDTLRAVTLYGPISYFNYRGEEMGFDYENIKNFASEQGMTLDLKVAPNMTRMIEMLEDKEVDIIAYPVPHIEEYKSELTYLGPQEISWQVLVKKKERKDIKDVTDLIGDTIWVEKNSRYHYRLINLNNELGGGIEIKTIERDSIIDDDLIEMVHEGSIPMTIVDSDIASLNNIYYPDLDMSLKVSLDQLSSWAVRKDSEKLIEKINNWEKEIKSSETLKGIYKKYFEISKNDFVNQGITFSDIKLNKNNSISEYDHLFKRYGNSGGIDWRLLASIGFNESRFDPYVQSRFGATGLMQIMPVAAVSVGIPVENLTDPESNVKAAVRVLKQLDSSLKELVTDSAERIKFVVAAYNSGIGHIYDAIALAEKYHLNPTKWTGNVSETSLLKSKPEYYNDPVVKHGYFRGRETVEFVERVFSVYEIYKQKTDKNKLQKS